MNLPSTIGAALELGRQTLSTISETPDLDTQLLLCHAVDRARAWILAHPEEALAAVKTIGEAKYDYDIAKDVAEALVGLAPHLPEALLKEALGVARAIKNESSRAEALSKLAPRLAEWGCSQEALAVAREIRDEFSRVAVLMGLAPHLPVREALAAARAIKSEGIRVLALSRLAPQLPESLQKEVLEEAIRIGRLMGERIQTAING